MSKTGRTNYRRGARGTRKAERHIVVRSKLRDPPDWHKLSRAVITMALLDAEKKAEARAAMNGCAAPEASKAPAAADADDTEKSDV
jgi:hypothetical protein